MKKKDRNMFYSNYQAGGFINPNYQNFQQMSMEPNGYQVNNNYMSYGPNAVPEQYAYDNYEDDYDARITRLEKQCRKLEARVSKLENSPEIISEVENNYII